MKIKAVCGLTGLSGRTIRYYIEQKLITPNYTENYLGRKTFGFSQKDIEDLNNIATLRKFGFTIEEIREIISNSQNSRTVIENVKERTEKSVSEEQEKLAVLTCLDTCREYTVKELAEKLVEFSANAPAPEEKYKKSVKETVVSILKAIAVFVIVWFPITLSFYVVILKLRDFRYPIFNIWAILLNLIFLLPSFAVMVISKLQHADKRAVKGLFLVFCVLSIPFCMASSWFTITTSKTTDISHYSHCTIGIELFPDYANSSKLVKQEDGSFKRVYFDTKFYYYYHTGLDYTFDIYAEWPLEEDKFKGEVDRVKELFDEYNTSKEYGDEYTVMQKGSYTCLIFYNTYDKSQPFEKVTDNYSYYIFAYDETNLRVRYIYCTSLENGVDQPYYLQLDW